LKPFGVGQFSQKSKELVANDRGDTPEDLAKRMGHSRLDEGTVMEPGREVLLTTASVVGESLISYCVFCITES